MTSEGTRPNVNYRLSRENSNPQEEEKLHFYYDRQNRLNKASPAVRRLYEQPSHKFSLLGPLINGKARAMVFFTIIIFCVVILMLLILGFFDKTQTLDGNKLEISATIIDDVTLIVLKKTIDSKEPYTGDIDIGVSPATQNEEFPIFLHRVSFTLQEEERFSFTVPYNSPRLAMVFQPVSFAPENSSLKITIKPE